MEELKATDGKYLVTSQGKEVEEVFEPPAKGGFTRAEIVSHGYYESY